MKDLLRIALSAMNDVDVRVLPTGVAINLAAARKLIKNHLDEEEKAAVKPAKKKAKKKVVKKK